jgi:hypothetical protein
MSIQQQIETCEMHGQMVRLRPIWPTVPENRLIYMTRRFLDELENWKNENEYRAEKLLAELDDYMAGEFITVGDGKSNRGFLKRLDPHSDEVWEVRSMEPKPSLRIFCRFVMPDVLLATHMERRTDLKGYGSSEFANAILTCKAEWRKCFVNWPPHSGETIHDYITENVGFDNNR